LGGGVGGPAPKPPAPEGWFWVMLISRMTPATAIIIID
jgi:hypothetical protein